MSQSDSISIIHRKARVGRKDFDARAMSPSKALRLALAKSADQLYELALTVATVEHHAIVAAAIPERVGDDGLLMLLDGAHGLRGAVKLDRQFVAALIETQIIGEVRRTEARARVYTRTDAAMTAPFLDSVLAGFDMQMQDHVSGYAPMALRFGDRVEDARLLGLALEGGQFDLYLVTVDLGEGAKTGVISVLLPKRARAERLQKDRKAGYVQAHETLKKNVLEASAVLDAVLARIQMPLKEICTLEPGMTLLLPPDALQQAELYAPMRHLVGEVHLGQLNGLRAVRLINNELPDNAVPSQKESSLRDQIHALEMQLTQEERVENEYASPDLRSAAPPPAGVAHGAALLPVMK